MAKKIATDKHEQPRVPPPIPTEDHQTRPNASGMPNGELPQPGPGGLGSFARFAATGRPETAPPEQVFACSVGRPGTTDYFRAYGDKSWWVTLHTFEAKDASGQRKIYVIDPPLHGLPELEGHIKRKMMVPCITLSGAITLWPISVDSSDNKYVITAQRICGEAVNTWMLCTTKRQIGEYRGRPSDVAHPDPQWPEMTLEKLLELAFPPESQILDRSHPVLAKLRGELA